jgi:hypothetical protein
LWGEKKVVYWRVQLAETAQLHFNWRYILWHFQIYLDGERIMMRLKLQLAERHVERLRNPLHVAQLISQRHVEHPTSPPLAELPISRKRSQPLAVAPVEQGTNNCPTDNTIPGGKPLPGIV